MERQESKFQTVIEYDRSKETDADFNPRCNT